jgi:molybdenum cofactor guanylyltransferase
MHLVRTNKGKRRVETVGQLSAVVGAVLAGGQARRLGARGKSAHMLGGRPLIRHVYDRVRDQVGEVVVNGSPETARLLAANVRSVSDLTADGAIEGRAGPLVGILSVLEWAADERPGVEWIATFPTDTPFLPKDFVARARNALSGDGADIACAASGGRVHPVVGVWPVGLAPALRRMVVDDGVRRADAILETFGVARIKYEPEPVDPFFNVNTADDLAAAEELLSGLSEEG